MSAAKIPSIRERMRRQEILARELGGASIEANTRLSTAGKRGSDRAQTRGRGQPDRGRDRLSHSGLPGFASLIRKVIAY